MVPKKSGFTVIRNEKNELIPTRIVTRWRVCIDYKKLNTATRFMRMENTIKLNGVRLEVIKLQLFPFSLRDMAATWFESLPYGSVNNWEELVETYISIFFLPALTLERRREIIVFKQEKDESLYNT